MVCGIYVIHNLINGKKYIGQSVDVYQRLSKHKSNLRNNYQSPNAHLQNAWNKYGEKAFDFGILKACKPRYLDRFEKLYIRAWDLQNPNYGYNKESGGKVCKNITQETRNKISQQWRNPNSLYNSETYRQTLRNTQRNIIKKAWSNPNSKYNSIEFRLKQSQSKKNAWDNPNSKYNSVEFKEKASKTMSRLRRNPDSIYNSEEYKKHHSRQRSLATNTTGFYRVTILYDKKLKKGFRWAYQYTENHQSKRITRADLNKLEIEVKKQKLPWIVLNNELAQKSIQLNNRGV